MRLGRRVRLRCDRELAHANVAASALRTVELAENATLEVYEGAPHGLCATHKERVTGDLLAFIAA